MRSYICRAQNGKSYFYDDEMSLAVCMCSHFVLGAAQNVRTILVFVYFAHIFPLFLFLLFGKVTLLVSCRRFSIILFFTSPKHRNTIFFVLSFALRYDFSRFCLYRHHFFSKCFFPLWNEWGGNLHRTNLLLSLLLQLMADIYSFLFLPLVLFTLSWKYINKSAVLPSSLSSNPAVFVHHFVLFHTYPALL